MSASDEWDQSADPTAITSNELADKLRTAMQLGELVAGQRLIEADLSDQYGATRGVVRATLLTLAIEGIVDRFPNRGARVRAISLQEAVELIEVRVGPESLVARKAAENLTDDGAAELRRLRGELERTNELGDLMAYSRVRQELERRLRELSGHTAAVQLLDRLGVQTASHQLRLSYRAGRAAASLDEHLSIIDAVLARDPEAAEQAMTRHLTAVRDGLRALS